MLKKYQINNESGMALVICLLVMVVLTMIGIGITMDSTTEIKIAGNLKNKAVSFQNADSGTTAAPEIIEDNLENPRNAAPYIYSDDNQVPAIKVLVANIASLSDTPTEIININAAAATGVSKLPINTTIDIIKTGHLSTGNAIQMAAGYEGVGKSAASGGYHAYFRCQSHDKQGGTVSNAEILYRHVPR
jgi:Tfp pilus assembly protein PilX